MNLWFKQTLASSAAAACLLTIRPAAAAQERSSQQRHTLEDQSPPPTRQKARPTPPSTGISERVDLADVEEHPSRYVGRAVTLRGEVDEVLGPRVFKIDEENWADLDGEILVTMASPLAALVDEGDEVTVSGTLRPFVRADFERDWRFFDVSPALELQLTRKPVMVAATLVNSDDKEMLAVTFPPISRGTADSASGASRTGGQLMMGTAGQTGGLRGEKDSVTDMNTLAKATDTRLVGRRATLTEVRVAALDENGGFWAATLAGDRLYVLPAAGEFSPTVGSTVSIDGYVLRMPRQMQRRLEERRNTGDEEIYLYAHRIT